MRGQDGHALASGPSVQFPSALPHGVLSFASALGTQPGPSLLPGPAVRGGSGGGKGWFCLRAESSPFWPPERPQGGLRGEEKRAGVSRLEGGRTQGGKDEVGRHESWDSEVRTELWGLEVDWGQAGGAPRIPAGSVEVAIFLRQRTPSSPEPTGLDGEGHRTGMSPCPSQSPRGSGSEPGPGPVVRSEMTHTECATRCPAHRGCSGSTPSYPDNYYH